MTDAPVSRVPAMLRWVVLPLVRAIVLLPSPHRALFQRDAGQLRLGGTHNLWSAACPAVSAGADGSRGP